MQMEKVGGADARADARRETTGDALWKKVGTTSCSPSTVDTPGSGGNAAARTVGV
jgi:hypothetical protein